jgi:hypothetical protein
MLSRSHGVQCVRGGDAHAAVVTCTCYALYMFVCIHVYTLHGFDMRVISQLLAESLPGIDRRRGSVGLTPSAERIEPQRTHSLSCTRHR